MATEILVRDSSGKLVLVTEIRNRQGLSPGAASSLRRDLITHKLLPSADFFLLVSQDAGYLWNDSLPADAPPSVQFPMSNVISRYLPGTGPNERLRSSELAMLVGHWLQDLAGPMANVQEPEKTLAGTGLLEAVRSATVVTHAHV